MTKPVTPVTNSGRGVPGWPVKFPEELLCVSQDTREKTPWTFDSCHSKPRIVVEGLKFGDYAVHGDPGLACVERKSLEDFYQCVGQHRERFFKQIQGLVGSCHRPLLIIEGDYGMIENAMNLRGRLTPDQILGCLHTVTSIIPTLLCRSRNEAERACLRHLRLAVKGRYQECREFVRNMNRHG